MKAVKRVENFNYIDASKLELSSKRICEVLLTHFFFLKLIVLLGSKGCIVLLKQSLFYIQLVRLINSQSILCTSTKGHSKPKPKFYRSEDERQCRRLWKACGLETRKCRNEEFHQFTYINILFDRY